MNSAPGMGNVLKHVGPLRTRAYQQALSLVPIVAWGFQPQVPRRANGYLGLNVAMTIQASDPVLVWAEHPIWRLQVHLYLRGLGR